MVCSIAVVVVSAFIVVVVAMVIVSTAVVLLTVEISMLPASSIAVIVVLRTGLVVLGLQGPATTTDAAANAIRRDLYWTIVYDLKGSEV